MHGRFDAVVRALHYPYSAPDHAYLHHGGGLEALEAADQIAAHRAGRVPVVAYGSNRAPQQLALKFPDLPVDDGILVEPVELAGWDVVYAARITSYGAVPARIVEHASVTVRVAVTWLSPAQLKRMDASEGGNYERAALPVGSVTTTDGVQRAEAQAYLGGGDILQAGGAPVALAAVIAEGRTTPQSTTADILRRVAGHFAPDHALEDFAARLGGDPDLRRRVTAWLRDGLRD